MKRELGRGKTGSRRKEQRGARETLRGSGQTCGMVAEEVVRCQLICYIIDMSFERAGRIRMQWVEVGRLEGVGGAFSSLIRLWKCVEKASSGPFSRRVRSCRARALSQLSLWRHNSICGCWLADVGGNAAGFWHDIGRMHAYICSERLHDFLICVSNCSRLGYGSAEAFAPLLFPSVWASFLSTLKVRSQ